MWGEWRGWREERNQSSNPHNFYCLCAANVANCPNDAAKQRTVQDCARSVCPVQIVERPRASRTRVQPPHTHTLAHRQTDREPDGQTDRPGTRHTLLSFISTSFFSITDAGHYRWHSQSAVTTTTTTRFFLFHSRINVCVYMCVFLCICIYF